MALNKKQISQILKNKMDDFIETLPDKLQSKVKSNCFITGGAIASLFLGQKVNDYDVYFSDGVTAYELARYYLKDKDKINVSYQGCSDNSIRSVDVIMTGNNVIKDYSDNDENEDKYELKFATETALTLNNKIQLILSNFINKPKEITSNYDFVHATNYWSYNEGLITNKQAMECLITKQLIYQGSNYPLSSIIRTRKFIKRGFNVDAGQYLKMVLQLNKLDLTDPEVLRKQLVGVDIVYFKRLLNYFEENDLFHNLNLNDTRRFVFDKIDEIFNEHIDNTNE